MREYETVIVLDPGLDDTRVDQEVETVSTVITQGGGEVLEVQRWGRRRLAYEVQKKREGNYSLIRFKSERGVLEELKRRYLLNESMLRHLTVMSLGPSAPPSAEGYTHGERRGEGYGHGGRRGEGYGGGRRGDRRDRDIEYPARSPRPAAEGPEPGAARSPAPVEPEAPMLDNANQQPGENSR